MGVCRLVSRYKWRYNKERVAPCGTLEKLCILELRAKVIDPREGCGLFADMYRSDSEIFEQCDDSDGYIGDVLRNEAKDLFVAFARECSDKKWLLEPKPLKLWRWRRCCVPGAVWPLNFRPISPRRFAPAL